MTISSVVTGTLRPRAHDRELPDRLTHLTDCNFIIRMLFYQVYWHYFTLHIYIFVLVIVFTAFWQCINKRICYVMLCDFISMYRPKRRKKTKFTRLKNSDKLYAEWKFRKCSAFHLAFSSYCIFYMYTIIILWFCHSLVFSCCIFLPTISTEKGMTHMHNKYSTSESTTHCSALSAWSFFKMLKAGTAV